LIYLTRFDLPGENKETEYKLGGARPELDWSCYSGSGYPFGIFPQKRLESIEFDSSVVIFCGENGSGKSTLLNVIADVLKINRPTPYNKAPNYDNFISLCRAHIKSEPEEKKIITSDSVFDFLLDIRAVNEGTEASRRAIYDSYTEQKRRLSNDGYTMKSLDDYEELKKVNEVRRSSLPEYAKKRVSRDIVMHSNGESALDIFESAIKENALYLLDEPENSLSASHQWELAEYISDSARFYGCQFIISSHSPFLLSLKGAEIYDLDARPVAVKRWTELGCIREYARIFKDAGIDTD
jgi:predicted ATPase